MVEHLAAIVVAIDHGRSKLANERLVWGAARGQQAKARK
jgi:hypothetical protein